jgi:hypothetical protein
MMQAYAQIIDKTLVYADLPSLGARLKSPAGWRYTTTVPDKDLIAGASGKATVIQDEFEEARLRCARARRQPALTRLAAWAALALGPRR